MKLLVIGDIHARNWSQFSTVDPETGLNSRFLDTVRILEWAERLSRDVDLVVQLGDIFDCRSKTENDVAVHTVNAFRRFTTPVIAIVGNHDCWGRTARDNTLSILPPIVDVVDSPRSVIFGSTSLLFHPFTPDVEQFKEWSRKNSGDLFFFHQGLNEAEIGAYHLSIPASLSYKDLPEARMRLGGHVHAPQQISKDTVIVGSTNQFSFGERDEHKRVMIIDTATWSFESVGSEAPEFHLYPGLPMARQGKHKDCDFIRIQCSKSEVEQAKEEFPKAQIEVIKELKKERRVIAEAASDDGLLDAYLTERKPELDKDRLLKMGQEFLSPG